MPNNQFDEDLASAMRTLARRDPALRALIRQHGTPTFRPHSDYFETLVDSIISQQISSKAADSIMRQFRVAFNDTIVPRLIVEAPDELIRGAGISPQKLGYLRSLSEHIEQGELELAALPLLGDKEVIERLTAVKGIGVWTAQMFLIFSLGRLDVLPTGDLGIRKGMQLAYSLAELPTARQIEEIAEANRWAPYRSVATWYMWRC
jgi:DNA-3-methyladenine glycosylase II